MTPANQVKPFGYTGQRDMVPVFEVAEAVPAGVVSIAEVNEQGYRVARP